MSHGQCINYKTIQSSDVCVKKLGWHRFFKIFAEFNTKLILQSMTRFMTLTIKRQFTRQLGTRLILDSQAKIIFLLSNKTTLQVKGGLISEGLFTSKKCEITVPLSTKSEKLRDNAEIRTFFWRWTKVKSENTNWD